VASRPLRVKELAQFLAFDFDVEPNPTFRADWRPKDPIDTVLSACPSFLAVVKRGHLRFIQFSHLSVKEYLTSDRLAGARESISRYHISTAPAHTLMVQACLGILLHLDEKEITRDSLKNFPIVEYAAKHWVYHTGLDSVSANTQDAMRRLFDPRRPHLAVWLWIYDPTISWRMRSERPTRPEGSCLHYAVYFGFHDLIRFLVRECSPDVNARGFDDMTALHWASRDGHLGCAQVLLERGADVRIQDKKKSTPLRYASDNGHLEVALLLLEHGAETNQGTDGWIPLCWASRHGHVELARSLLKHGVDANTRDRNKSTSLHLASEGGHVEVVQLLLEHSADVNVEDKKIWTPLRYALEKGHMEVARLLLEHGADANAKNGYDGWIPLHWASRGGRVDVAQLLLECGVDANFQDRHESTPLHLASRNGHVEVARLLLERGIDASAQNKSKSTPLHLVSEGGCVQLARLLLLQHGVDPSAQDVNKRTPLHLASKNGHTELARVLLQPEYGVNVDDRDVDMWTSLHWAARGGHVEVAGVLLQCGADAKAKDTDKWTPLHLLSGDGEVEVARLVLGRAVDTGSRGMVKLLQLYRDFQTSPRIIPLEYREDVIVQDLFKLARLGYRSRRSGHVELARVLLENGADVSAQDKDNSTPLHWASGCGLVELVRVFLENGADASAQDKDKSTPLHRVSESGQVAFVRGLWGLLQPVERRSEIVRSLSSSKMCGELAELLLTHNVDVGAQDKDKLSPLHLASGGAGFWGSATALGLLDTPLLHEVTSFMRLVQGLLTHGADVRARDKDNSTPLHWTSGGGYVKLARTLLKRSENVFKSPFDRRPRSNLGDFGSDWNQRYKESWSIHVEVARVLLEHGADADVNVQDIFGLTPLQRARRAGFFDVTQLLLSHGST
jgi:ankyrin repeat protein